MREIRSFEGYFAFWASCGADNENWKLKRAGTFYHFPGIAIQDKPGRSYGDLEGIPQQELISKELKRGKVKSKKI